MKNQLHFCGKNQPKLPFFLLFRRKKWSQMILQSVADAGDFVDKELGVRS